MGWLDYKERCKRECAARRTLRTLSRLQVTHIHGEQWYVSQPFDDDDGTSTAIQTCLLRGWIEEVQSASDGQQYLYEGGRKQAPEPPRVFPGSGRALYRVTATGWANLHRIDMWIILGAASAVITAAAGLLGLIYQAFGLVIVAIVAAALITVAVLAKLILIPLLGIG